MSILALCPKFFFPLFYEIFEWEWTGLYSPFSPPCFPGFAFVPRTLHFRKASMKGRFCSWSSSSSLKKFGSVVLRKKGSFCELLSKPHSHMFDHQKGQPLCRLEGFVSCAFSTPLPMNSKYCANSIKNRRLLKAKRFFFFIKKRTLKKKYRFSYLKSNISVLKFLRVLSYQKHLISSIVLSYWY